MTEDELRHKAVEIRALWRKACFAYKQSQRLNLAMGAFIRTQLGWRKDLPEKERNKIAKQAAAIIVSGAAEHPEFREIVNATWLAMQPFENIEDDAVRAMERLVKSIPFMVDMKEATPGLGFKGIGIIIAEACNDKGSILSDYPKKGHLWKRMGLGLVEKDIGLGEFVRQGNAGKNASAETWQRHGYNKQRRSRIYTIGDSLLKPTGPYRDIYLARKEFETEKFERLGMKVLKAAEKPKKGSNVAYVPAMVIHRRAQRYMEKRLLNDMRKVWRREARTELPRAEANDPVPSVSTPSPLPMAAE